MAEIGGFWSYVHADDDADGGRIAQLARDVVAQYEMLTGDSIHLFLDRDDIEWGDEWKPKIDSTLESTAFFVPILTPRYFRSVECRRELNFFARRATAIGIKELVLPILYVDFDALHGESCQDDAIVLTRSFHWEVWTSLRFAALDSPEYRRAVSSLAKRLAAASASAEAVETTEAVVEAIQDDDDPSPGFMDRIARMETALPELASTLDDITREIQNITEIVNPVGEELHRKQAQGAGFAARLIILNELAQSLDPPVIRMVELANGFTAQLNDVDLGLKVLVESIPREIAEYPEHGDSTKSFVATIRHMVREAETALDIMEQMAKSIEPVEQGSRNARPVLRKLRKAVTLLAEGRSVTREWNALLDELGLDESE